jgi:hypothetical protein
MSGNHDLGYKQLFAHPEMVRDLLAGFTEFECFRGLAVTAFEHVNASYVLPVVFYNGKTAWNASEELRHLVAAGPDELEPYQASQRYLLIDQTTLDPTALDGARNLVAALCRIELCESADILMDVAATLGVWLAGEEQSLLRQSILCWISRLKKDGIKGGTIPEVQRLLEGETMGERFQRRYANMVEYILDAGLQKGLAQGREEGRLQTLRAMLKLQLAQRFGPVSAIAATRIEEASEAEVERWVGGLLTADSTDALLAS